jgi:A118 family predicted phage portal protein
MVFMNSTLFAQDDQGRFIAPQMMGDSLFINVGDRLKSEKSLLEEYNPQLRVEENANGVQRMLDIFSFKIGLGKGFYKLDEDGMVKTATEYTGSKQALVRNIAREMIGVESALKQLMEAILWIGEYVLKAPGVKYEADVRVVADDSYITDEYTERKVWQEEVAQGLRSKQEYRERFMGESQEEAAKAIEGIKAESPSITNLLSTPPDEDIEQ